MLHQFGWRDVVQEDASGFRVVPELPGVPPSAYLGDPRHDGPHRRTSACTEIAQLREGDTVFVSGAAGAVGTRPARSRGC